MLARVFFFFPFFSEILVHRFSHSLRIAKFYEWLCLNNFILLIILLILRAIIISIYIGTFPLYYRLSNFISLITYNPKRQGGNFYYLLCAGWRVLCVHSPTAREWMANPRSRAGSDSRFYVVVHLPCSLFLSCFLGKVWWPAFHIWDPGRLFLILFKLSWAE